MKISRRALLAGLGTTALALPTLEVFGERSARAGTAPQRMLVLFAGMSGGQDGFKVNTLVPTATGANYPLTQVLAPLAKLGVANKVSVVSGLALPRDSSQPGGLSNQWHQAALGPIMSGVAVTSTDGRPQPHGQTADQFAADALSTGVPFRSLNYRVQAVQRDGDEVRGIISYRKVGEILQPNDPTVDARQAYAQLVANVKPTDPVAAQKVADQILAQKSAVDLASGKQSLLARLGRDDRQRLQQHFDELAALEARLRAPTSACVIPQAPNDDTTTVNSWTNENDRYPLLNELIRTAFACDLARVATLCVSHTQSYLSTKYICSAATDTDCHETSHSFDPVRFQEVIAWHVNIFADLVKRLAATPDVDGKTVLDNTAVVYVFEGGNGFDPQGNTQVSAHSGENMAMLVAGRAAGPAQGQHVVAGGVHPSSVLLSALHNVGANIPQLGDITTTIPALLG